MFRAFQLSRNETVALWGYDQDFLVSNACFNELTLKQLLQDFLQVRKASRSFIGILNEKQLNTKGMARQNEVTLKDYLISILGHERHHIGMIKVKYL